MAKLILIIAALFLVAARPAFAQTADGGLVTVGAAIAPGMPTGMTVDERGVIILPDLPPTASPVAVVPRSVVLAPPQIVTFPAVPLQPPTPSRPHPPGRLVVVATPIPSPPPPPVAQPLPPPPPPGPTELRVADPGGQHRMTFEVVGEWAGWLLVNGQPTLSRQASTRGNQTVWVHVDPAVNLPGGQPGQVQLQMICGGPRPRRLPPRWVWPDTWHQINPIQGCW